MVWFLGRVGLIDGGSRDEIGGWLRRFLGLGKLAWLVLLQEVACGAFMGFGARGWDL